MKLRCLRRVTTGQPVMGEADRAAATRAPWRAAPQRSASPPGWPGPAGGEAVVSPVRTHVGAGAVERRRRTDGMEEREQVGLQAGQQERGELAALVRRELERALEANLDPS